MKIAGATVTVFFTLIGLLILLPIAFFGAALLFGKGMAWVLLAVGGCSMFYHWAMGAEKKSRSQHFYTEQQNREVVARLAAQYREKHK